MRSRGGTAVLELLATPARAVIIASDPGCRARCRGLPGGAAQEKIDVREIFGFVRFDTDDYLPVVSFTKPDDLFAFGHRPHANYRGPFVGSQLRHSGFSLRVSNSSLSACPRFRNLHGQPHRPGPASDPLRHQAQPGMAVIRLLDPNRSARTGPSEQVVAIALRHTFPEFLATAAKTVILVKFLRDRLDLSRAEGTSLAA